MSEIYYTGDTSRTMYDVEMEQAYETIAKVREMFPWVRREDYFSVSSPAYHEILKEQVVTCCFPIAATQNMVGPEYALGNRKFCLQSGTSFLRLYKLFDGELPSWMPKSSKVMFIGDNHREFGRPYPEAADTFYDLYFRADEQEAETVFNLPQRRGQYETFYGVTVKDGQPVRVKQYVYDAQGGFSDWDVVHMMHCKRLGRQDLLNA